MSLNDANYISSYQHYLSSKSSENLKGNKTESQDATKTKTIHRKIPPLNCNLCRLLLRREDMYKILNQGLFNKYTSSLDYYYTKDINAIILKKRKAFTIKFRDEQIFDDEREYLKKFFRKKETAVHMVDIKNFYTKFKDYPKFFDIGIFGIMSSMVRKHRRLEYYKVFKGKKPDERDPPLPEEEQFQFVEMLGESFKQQQIKNDLYKRNSTKNGQQTPREQRSIIEIKKSFKELLQFKDFTQTDHKFSSDYFQYHTTTQNYYQLYSRTDSLSALDDFESMMDEFNATKQQQQHYQPILKSQVGINKSYKKDLVMGNISSTRMLTNTKEGSGKKMVEETRPLTSKGFSNPASGNPSQEIFNFNVSSTRNIKQSINANRQTSLHNNYQAPPLIKQQSTPLASDQQASKQTNRASSLDKYENTQRDTQKVTNLQNQTSSDNFRFQSSGASTNNLIKGSAVVSSVRESNQTGQKKLLLDTKDLQVDKQGLYRTINQRWKTINSSNHNRMPSTGKLYIPMTESTNSVANRENQKEGVPSSNRYILTKRTFGAKSNPYEYNSVVVGESNNEANSPSIVNKYSKSTSQGNLDKNPGANISKNSTEKPGILEELDRENVRNRQSEFENLARNSKAYTSSKKLLEKVFANDSNHQQLVAALIKSPNKKIRQVKIPSVQQKDEGQAPSSLAENTYFNFLSSDSEKRASPMRQKNGSNSNKNDWSSNMNTQPLLIGQSSVAKIYGTKPETKDIVSQVMKKNFSSKLVLTSPKVKLQPYREQAVGRTTRRNKTTEPRGDNSTQKIVDATGGLSVHFRQKSNDNRYQGNIMQPERNVQKIVLT